ncbi:AAC(3) family N-acetyltransferase [Floccifex sp.]|uniref:AAC(3) family N-acetyltransferase n=1 Tax=Floccifex sp. TaxID=2815810 RepID=UPI003F0DBDF4
MSNVLFKQDFIDVLNELKVEQGSLICLQANLSKFPNVLGGYQTLFDAIWEVIGEDGCIMIPSFTYSSLDPACMGIYYDYQDWQQIREEMPGYNTALTMSDVNSLCVNQFMMQKGVIRSNHPVYSFVFKGNMSMDWVKQTMNYPISFGHVLKGFAHRKAYNILIGFDKEESVLLPAIAKTIGVGSVQVEKAYVQTAKKKMVKTYLNVKCDLEQRKELLEYCYVKESMISNQVISCLSIEELA